MSFRTFMKTHGKAIVSYVICIIVIITIVLVSVYMNIFSETTPSAPATSTHIDQRILLDQRTPSTINVISEEETHSEQENIDVEDIK